MRKWLFERDGIWLLFGYLGFGLGILLGYFIWG